MDDSLVLALRSAATGAETKEDAYLFDAAADLIEQQADRITALESERATLLHDVEIHAQEAIYAHAKVEAMEKQAGASVGEIADLYIWLVGDGENQFIRAWTDNPDKVEGLRNTIGLEPSRYCAAPPSQPDTRWIDVNDRLPEIDYSKPEFDRQVSVLASWGGNKVAEMKYVSHGYAKREKGRAPRFEWQGRISPWLVTHWMPLPEAPANQKQAG
ncbi:UNVERIFIED_ORG: hypothetical protein ABIC54_004414 [Burkholderia sp. 1263]